MTPSRVSLSSSLLDEARAFFESRGALGVEGTALIAARTTPPDGHRLVVPEQRAGRGGCWVEVTLAGKLALAAALAPDERYVARIHSHPGEAFHSATDDRNPALTHEGALSIVVPYFGLGLRHGLSACAVFVRRRDEWIELPPGAARDAWLEVV
jgi:hypothetical protein